MKLSEALSCIRTNQTWRHLWSWRLWLKHKFYLKDIIILKKTGETNWIAFCLRPPWLSLDMLIPRRVASDTRLFMKVIGSHLKTPWPLFHSNGFTGAPWTSRSRYTSSGGWLQINSGQSCRVYRAETHILYEEEKKTLKATHVFKLTLCYMCIFSRGLGEFIWAFAARREDNRPWLKSPLGFTPC